MFCKFCGNPVDRSSMRCTVCGKPAGPLTGGNSFRDLLEKGGQVPGAEAGAAGGPKLSAPAPGAAATPPRTQSGGDREWASRQFERIYAELNELKKPAAPAKPKLFAFPTILSAAAVLLSLVCLIIVLVTSGRVGELQKKVETQRTVVSSVDTQKTPPESPKLPDETEATEEPENTEKPENPEKPENTEKPTPSPAPEVKEIEIIDKPTSKDNFDPEQGPAFTVGVTGGSGEFSFTWQKKNAETESWDDLTEDERYRISDGGDKKSSKLYLTGNDEDYNGAYRCFIQDLNDETQNITTDEVSLTMKAVHEESEQITITVQPLSKYSFIAKQGEKVFEVTFLYQEEHPACIWEKQNPETKDWEEISEKLFRPGMEDNGEDVRAGLAKDFEVTLSLYLPIDAEEFNPEDYDGSYRCKIIDDSGNFTYTNTVLLRLKAE